MPVVVVYLCRLDTNTQKDTTMQTYLLRSLIYSHKALQSYAPLTMAEVDACVKALTLDYVADLIEHMAFPSTTLSCILKLAVDLMRDE
jgi:hypothetical protein